MRLSEKTYNALFHKHYHKIVTELTYIVGPDYAEEAATDAFIYAKDKQFNSPGHARRYIYLAAKCRALNIYKHYKLYNKRLQDIVWGVTDWVPSPEHNRIAWEKLQQLQNAIDHLPPKCRRIIELFYIWGKSYNEICSMLNANISTVRNQRKRGMGILKEQLKGLIYS